MLGTREGEVSVRVGGERICRLALCGRFKYRCPLEEVSVTGQGRGSSPGVHILKKGVAGLTEALTKGSPTPDALAELVSRETKNPPRSALCLEDWADPWPRKDTKHLSHSPRVRGGSEMMTWSLQEQGYW